MDRYIPANGARFEAWVWYKRIKEGHPACYARNCRCIGRVYVNDNNVTYVKALDDMGKEREFSTYDYYFIKKPTKEEKHQKHPI